jgi:hypothetical protein
MAGRLVNALKKALKIYRQYGFFALLARAKKKIHNKMKLSLKAESADVMEIIKQRNHDPDPILNIKVNREKTRLNVVTDSINSDSLFGGVATALILATIFAEKNSMDLRIITRTARINPLQYFNLIKMYRISRPSNVEFYSDFDRHAGDLYYKLEISKKDIFLATSWWSAAALSKMQLEKRFFYLVQEVEPFFYPQGDDRLLCEQTLQNSEIDFIINTKLLFDYFKSNKYSGIAENGCFFEPAFPGHIFCAGEYSHKKKDKYTLFFYSRPNNPRNLYRTGLEYLNEALTAGVIDGEKWEIVLAGDDVRIFIFSNGKKPVLKGRLTWQEYSRLASETDLAFSLMYTPHPSYPPLDMAASGAVVLTNTYLNKQGLEAYSDNIITADLNSDAMLEGFRKAISLAQSPEKRKLNYLNNCLKRSWEDALEPVFVFMKSRLKKE